MSFQERENYLLLYFLVSTTCHALWYMYAHHPVQSLEQLRYLHLHFTNEETGIQRSYITCPKLPSGAQTVGL